MPDITNVRGGKPKLTPRVPDDVRNSARVYADLYLSASDGDRAELIGVISAAIMEERAAGRLALSQGAEH